MGIMFVLSYLKRNIVRATFDYQEETQTRLEHLPVPHFNWQEHHHQSREPNATCTQPENARASVGKQLCSGVRCNNTSDTTQT